MQRLHRPSPTALTTQPAAQPAIAGRSPGVGPSNTDVLALAEGQGVDAEGPSYLEALAGHDHDHEEGEAGHDHDHEVLAALQEDNPLRRQPDPLPAVEGTQIATVGGIEIRGTGVSPSAMQAAQRVLEVTIGANPAMQERMQDRDVRVVIVPAGKALTELAEFESLHGQRARGAEDRYWQDIRGVGGHRYRGDIVVAIPEENLIDSAERFDSYGADQSIAVHEFAHAVNRQGMTRDQKRQLDRLYRQQRGDAGGFTDAYAASHVEEYFAQASQYFFASSDYATLETAGSRMANGASDGPEHLRRTDPDMYAFLVSIYGDPIEALERAGQIEVGRHNDGSPVVAAPRPTAPAATAATS